MHAALVARFWIDRIVEQTSESIATCVFPSSRVSTSVQKPSTAGQPRRSHRHERRTSTEATEIAWETIDTPGCTRATRQSTTCSAAISTRSCLKRVRKDSSSISDAHTDVDIPAGALPPYQDEVDDSALPVDTHPSYPYGNPYRSTAGSRLALPFPHAHARSLASTLPSVYLARLGGARPSSGWNDLGLDELLPYEEPPEPPGMPGGVNEHSGAPADDEEQGMNGVEAAGTTADGSGGDEEDEDLSADEESEQNGDRR